MDLLVLKQGVDCSGYLRFVLVQNLQLGRLLLILLDLLSILFNTNLLSLKLHANHSLTLLRDILHLINECTLHRVSFIFGLLLMR